MSLLPNGVVTRSDAILMLRNIDGQTGDGIGAWDIDDFMSVAHRDPVIERCRLRVRNELVDLLSSTKPEIRARIPELVNDIVNELNGSIE